MNNEEFKVLHGVDANLPETKSDNILYHTTDTHRTFMGVTELQNKDVIFSDTYFIDECQTIDSALITIDTILGDMINGNNIYY